MNNQKQERNLQEDEEKSTSSAHPELERKEEDLLEEKRHLFHSSEVVVASMREECRPTPVINGSAEADKEVLGGNLAPPLPPELQNEEELLKEKKLMFVDPSADTGINPAEAEKETVASPGLQNQEEDFLKEKRILFLNPYLDEPQVGVVDSLAPPTTRLMRSSRNDTRPATLPGAIPYRYSGGPADLDPSEGDVYDDVVTTENHDIDTQEGRGGGGDETLVSAFVVEEVDEEMQARAAEEKARDTILQEMVQGEIVDVNEKKSKTRKTLCMVLAMAVLVVVVIVVVLATTLTGKDKTNSVEEPMSDYDYLVTVLSPISGEDHLLNETTSQNKALRWMLEQDGFLSDNSQANNTIQTISDKILVERYALAVLYYSTQGDSWLRDVSFLSNSSVCEWPPIVANESKTDGVSCNENNRVTDLDLTAMNLNGTIPAELGQLAFLRNLNMDDNLLHGTLPNALSQLNFLKHFSAPFNHISGSIPVSFADLNNLEKFRVPRNSLSGTIPMDIFQIESLQQFDAGENRLTGTIPEFPARGKMESLWLNSNMLEGSIPDSFFTSREIVGLGLFDNMLTGSLPNSVGNLAKMFIMYIDGNKLSGALPTELGLLKSMEFMWLNRNNFTGAIPSEIGELGKFGVISEIVLESTQLSGEVPSELGLLTSIHTIDLIRTSISGDLDPFFCDLAIPKLSADCGGDAPETQCSCCTECCNDISGECLVNMDLMCSRMAEAVKNTEQSVEFVIEQDDVKPVDPICQCSELPQLANQTCFNGKCPVKTLACNESLNCTVCNPDDSICGRRVNFGYTWDKNGVWTHQTMGFQYTKGRDDLLVLEFDVSAQSPPYLYKMYLNGEECNELNAEGTCADGKPAFEVDCSNVQEGAVYSQCDGLMDNAGALEYFTPNIYGVPSSCGD